MPFLYSLIITGLLCSLAGGVNILLTFQGCHFVSSFLLAGVAIACMVSWGIRVWPAIVIASAFSSRGLDFFVGTDIHVQAQLGWTVLAGGAIALQAAVATGLVSKFVSQPLVLEEPRDIARFLFLAGPIASVINSALMTLAMVLFGHLDNLETAYKGSIYSVFLTGWFNDTLGVFLATPMALTYIGMPTTIWRSRYWTVGAPLAAAIGLMAAALQQVQRWDQMQARYTFEREVTNTFNELRLRLQHYQDAMDSLSSIYVSVPGINHEDFHRGSIPWLAALPGVYDLVWQSNQPAVAHIAPYPPFMDQSIKTVFAAAQVTPHTLISAPFSPPGQAQKIKMVVMVRAVPNLANKTNHAKAYLYVAINIDEAVISLLHGLPRYLSACLIDIGTPDQASLTNLTPHRDCQSTTYDKAPQNQALTLPVMGRTWQLRVWANQPIPHGTRLYHWLIGVGGMAFSAAFSALLLIMTGRARRIEAAVQERTMRLNFEIAERYQAEQALRTSEQRFKAIFDSVPIGVVYTDLDGLICQANPGFCLLTGYAESSLVGMPLQMLAHPEDRDEHLSLRQQLLSRAELVITLNQRYLTRLGHMRQVNLSMRLLQISDDQPLGMVGVAEDVTDRLQLHNAERAREMAEASNRAKTDFLSRMSHELRTPLNAMLGFAQLLDMDTHQPLGARHKTWVQQIQDAGWHLLSMINDILDLSRIESGTLRLDIKAHHIAELVHSAYQLLEAQAKAKQVNVHFALTLLNAPPVWSDSTRTKQILSNLLSNAIKYNRQGGQVSVQIRLLASEQLAIDVIDNGLGIQEARLGDLFKPFNRLGQENSAIDGTGIGIVISQRLAELMNGTLAVQSIYGEGSTFSLILPLASSHTCATPAAHRPIQMIDQYAVYHQRRVVYIEDNDINAIVMSGVFAQRPQVKLDIYKKAQEALQVIYQTSDDSMQPARPDLILLDMHLPDLPGIDLLRQLKANPQTQHIPVVVISADVLTEHIQQALDAGAVDYLTKPFSVGDVLKLVDELLEECDTLQ